MIQYFNRLNCNIRLEVKPCRKMSQIHHLAAKSISISSHLKKLMYSFGKPTNYVELYVYGVKPATKPSCDDLILVTTQVTFTVHVIGSTANPAELSAHELSFISIWLNAHQIELFSVQRLALIPDQFSFPTRSYPQTTPNPIVDHRS